METSFQYKYSSVVEIRTSIEVGRWMEDKGKPKCSNLEDKDKDSKPWACNPLVYSRPEDTGKGTGTAERRKD